MRRRLSAGAIAGLGVATASLTLWFVVTSEATSELVFLADVVVPLLFSALLVGASYWAWADRTNDSAMIRLALWCLIGGVVGGGFEFVTLYTQFEEGVELHRELQTLNAGLALGAVVGLAFGFYDVERQRTHQREQQLERQVERLEEFASVVSHDLRSPLTVARGRIELLKASHDLDEEHVGQIEFAHERMTEIIEDSLALARGGHKVTDPTSVDIESVADSAWQTAGSADARLTVETTAEIEADEDRLTRLFENLFRNSVEHGSTSNRTQSGDSVEHGSTSNRTQSGDSVEHGSTDNRTAAEQAELTITVGVIDDGFYVEDDGVGVPVDNREQLFEAGKTANGSGSGLGLAIVRRIAEAHGWEVTLTDSTSGGARFEFREG